MRLLKIGHDQRCDIVMHSTKVSALHAELTLLDSGDMLLEDKNSTNGTYIMNQRIQPGQPVKVRRGDAIRLADTELQWGQVPMPEDNSAYHAIFGVGSHTSNDIQIAGATVSRYHATIKQGRDGKMYIVDHSKNGTTVDGQKISSNMPVRIKRKSAIVCGGVPVDTSRLPWPNEAWKTIMAAAAVIALVFGAGFGIYQYLITHKENNFTDAQLYTRYNSSVAMLVGIYHYEITVGDLDLEYYNSYADQIEEINGVDTHIWPQALFINDRLYELNGVTSKMLIEATDKTGLYSATGFFVSSDGQLITNLHVVKPWLFSKERESIFNEYSKRLAKYVDFMNNIKNTQSTILRLLNPSGLSSYLSQIKVEGVLDYVALIPQGGVFDPDNIIKCRVLSAGEDPNKDIALLQTINQQLPNQKCTYLNLTDSMDVNNETLEVGRHMYVLGFPAGMKLQDSNDGIQLYANGGNITHYANEFQFGFDAAAFNGSSGSPIFNSKGMLIGILDSGASISQGFNRGIKAKYIKELLDNHHAK